MVKKILIMLLLLAVVLPAAACTVEPSAQEIVDGVIEAWDDVKTQECDMDMTMDMTGEAEGESFEMTMAMSFSGALDIENKEMRADVSTDMTMPEEEAMVMEMAVYVVGGTGYVMMDVPGMDPTWMKADLSAADWGEISEGIEQTGDQIELLKTAQVEVIGSEKVKGVDCYVLRLTPDLEQLWETAMQSSEAAETGLPDVEEEFIQEMFRDFSVKQWIAKDTYFLMKAEIDMSVELTPEAMGYPEEEGAMTMNIKMSLLCYNYNQPVSIVLPPEAEEATDMIGLEEEARRTEYYNTSVAVIAMMVDNEIAYLPNPHDYSGGVAYNDMTRFPDSTTTAADKGYTGTGTPKAGYVLYSHDLIGTDTNTFETVNYLASATTTYYYTCEADGTVRQWDGPDVTTATEYEY